MTSIDASLIAAYRATNYIVFDDGLEIVLRIEEINPAADALLMRHGAEQASVITAWNPHSVPSSDAENEPRQNELWHWIAQHHLFALPAEGRDPSGQWSAEESFLIFDITPQAAEELGRRFGQNAIVSISRGQAPSLILLR
jgi:hypothetical protein